MSGKEFSNVVEAIISADTRFEKGAYYFVRQGLDYTLRTLKEKTEKEGGLATHVTGQQLLEGIREFALEQYGPMAYTLLTSWGLEHCEEFGDIVFNLVEYGVLGKTESDKREDFQGGYTFEQAFVAPFLPEARTQSVIESICLDDPDFEYGFEEANA